MDTLYIAERLQKVGMEGVIAKELATIIGYDRDQIAKKEDVTHLQQQIAHLQQQITHVQQQITHLQQQITHVHQRIDRSTTIVISVMAICTAIVGILSQI